LRGGEQLPKKKKHIPKKKKKHLFQKQGDLSLKMGCTKGGGSFAAKGILPRGRGPPEHLYLEEGFFLETCEGEKNSNLCHKGKGVNEGTVHPGLKGENPERCRKKNFKVLAPGTKNT